jgi:hypothetical protein
MTIGYERFKSRSGQTDGCQFMVRTMRKRAFPAKV